MNKVDNFFEILAVGLDSISIETIKKCLKENEINNRIRGY